MNRRRFLKQGAFGAIGIGPTLSSEAFGLPFQDRETADNRQTGEISVAPAAARLHDIDLRDAVVVSRPGDLPPAERTASKVLVEEVEKRTAIRLRTSTEWPQGKPVIAISSAKPVPQWRLPVPERDGQDLPENRSEGYRLYVDTTNAPPVVWIIGADARGTLFGAGHLLRRFNWSHGMLKLPANLDIATAPAYSIRGHQLGYRATTNTYDAWNPSQFEQYIRELTFFGVNSIEGIPFHDTRPTPVMKFPRREMNRALGEICQRYGLDYWVWVPADFDLRNDAKRRQLLNQCVEFFEDTPVLTGFTFPGGDPGDNPPELVLPFLEEVARALGHTHPEAKVWLSLQHFTPVETNYTFGYIRRHMPDWLGGLVGGPGSPPLEELRSRLPEPFGLHDYPDITHQVRCQYQMEQWDQAYALTEGRESVNPRPVEYAAIFSRTAGYTNGFISYSEGVNDDVNKTIWSALGWDPDQTPREILIDYARIYFKPDIAARAADAILALEKNWQGPLIGNGAVEATLLEWQNLAALAPDLENNWRWQMCLLRANYDAYVRRRLINESRLEYEANKILAKAEQLGSERSMMEATEVLQQAVKHPVGVQLRNRISELCDRLFHSVGMQTSVEKYYAVGEERGAVLDFVDYPLNNRWWLEDQFKAIRGLKSETEKRRRLVQLAIWEHPGAGSFYDDLGNIAKSPHVVNCYPANGPELKEHPQPTFWWWDHGKSRARLSWQVTLWPIAVVYEGLDPNAKYVVRTTGYGQDLLRLNGERVESTVDGHQMGEFKEFHVAAEHVKGRKLVLTWDRPENEEKLNWRERSRLAEVWLLKNPGDHHRPPSTARGGT